MSKLGNLLDRDRVLALASDQFLEGGERYVSEGRVRAIDEDDSAIVGIVSGTHDYEVRIWVEGDALAYACDCPIGADGAFCKHLVALAVAWLGESADRSCTKPPAPRQSRDRPRPITMADVRAYLDGQDHGTLVEMILAETIGTETFLEATDDVLAIARDEDLWTDRAQRGKVTGRLRKDIVRQFWGAMRSQETDVMPDAADDF